MYRYKVTEIVFKILKLDFDYISEPLKARLFMLLQVSCF